LTAEIVSAAKKHPHARVRAGLGSVEPSLHEAAVSRGEADRILDAMAHDLGAEIATIADVRSQVLVSEVLTTLGEHRRFRDPRLRRLVEHDAEHGAELAGSLLAYLEAFGEVRAASERLHVHPNTLRYRVRRAKEVAGLDLSDPSERLNVQLQLLLARRSAPGRREQPPT
jgi:DNA-binding PucR family transcriptional regulator